MKKIIALIIFIFISYSCFASINLNSVNENYKGLINIMLYNYYRNSSIDYKKIDGNAEFRIEKYENSYYIVFKLKLIKNSYTEENSKISNITISAIISEDEIDRSIERSGGEPLVSKENEAVLRFVNNFINNDYEIKI